MPTPGDVIGSAFVEIRPEVSAFENALQQGLAGPIQRSGSLLSKAFTGAAVGLAGIATGAIAAVNHTIDLGQAAYEMGEKFGLSGKQASTFIAIGKLVGVSSDQMGIGMRTLSKQLNTTAIDLKGHASAATLNKLPLQELGIASTDASGHLRDMAPVLSDIADKFAAMPDGPQKAALATQLFGRAGTDLIPILDQGSKGIADLTAQAAAEGAIMSGPQVDAAHQAYLAHQKLNEAMSGVALTLGSALMPYFAEAANWLSKHLPDAINTLHRWIDTHKQDIEHWAGVIKDVLVNAFSTLRDVVADVFNNFLKPLGQFAIDHKQVFIDLGVAIAGLFVAKKVGSAAKGWVDGALKDLGRLHDFLLGDLTKAAGGVFGGGSSKGGALSMVGVQKVYVVNWEMMSGGGAAGAARAVGSTGLIGKVAGITGTSTLVGTAAAAAIPLSVVAAGVLGILGVVQGPQGWVNKQQLPLLHTWQPPDAMSGASPVANQMAMNLSQYGSASGGGGFFNQDSQNAIAADLQKQGLSVAQARDAAAQIAAAWNKSEQITPGLIDQIIEATGGTLNGSQRQRDAQFAAALAAEKIPPQLYNVVNASGLAAKSGKDFAGGVQWLAANTGAPLNQILSAYTLTAGFAQNMVGYQQQINGILAAGVTLASGVEAKIGSIRGSAGGNDFPAGGLSWVGEKGKELVALPAGSRVIPHGESLNLAQRSGNSNGNNVTIYQNLTINGGDPAQVQAIIHQEFRSLELSLRAQ